MSDKKDTQGTGVHGAMVKDPVCGMDVNPASAGGRYEYGGRTYHFCSAHCLAKFRAEPGKFASPAASVHPPAR